MKKRILGILLCLCMALMLFPVTVFAEGETPEPVTEIAIEVDTPLLGENPEFGCGYSSNPPGVIYVDLEDWYRIPKDAYTGTAADVWEGMFGTGYTCDEDHYYKAVFSIGFFSGENGYIPNDVSATINNENCEIEVAADGKSCTMSYVFEAKAIQPVSNIAVIVDEPIPGNTPDFTPEVTANPNGSVELVAFGWYKIPEDDYINADVDDWEEMYEDDVFEAGYYYSVDMAFNTAANYYQISEDISATVNGMPHNDTYGDVYEDYYNYAYVCGVFGPLEPLYTVTVPFTTTVTQGGNVAPGETVFSLAVVETNAGEEDYEDVTVSATVTTNGAGSYSGTMTFTGPFEQVRNMLCEGAFVQQVNAGAANWTYDDTVWGLILTDAAAFAFTGDAGSPYSVLIFPANCEETGNGGMVYSMADGADAVERMNFSNTYTKSATGPAQPTENNPNTGAVTNPKTGDKSNLTLWFALLVVSTAGVIGTGVYSKRRRSF